MRIYGIFTIYTCLTLVSTSFAGGITAEAMMLAKQGTPIVAGTVSDMTGIAKTATKLLYIPKGILQAAFSVLPGPTLNGGLNDIGRGLAAATSVTGQTVRLPINLIKRSSKSIKNISPIRLAN